MPESENGFNPGKERPQDFEAEGEETSSKAGVPPETSLAKRGRKTDIGTDEKNEGEDGQTNIHIENLGDLEKNFPGLEIITKEKESLIKDHFPSSASMQEISPDEPVWLTTSAVEDRLRVLLHTHPEFNRKAPIALYAEKGMGAAAITVQKNTREGVEPSVMIANLEEMGFSFVEDKKTTK